MGSLLSMGINAITNAAVYAVKAFFSLVTWFLKAFLKTLKLFFVLLPVTSVIFVLLILLSIIILCTGQYLILPAGAATDGATGILANLLSFANASDVIHNLFAALSQWWQQTVSVYKGQASYILLIILTVLMFIPVITVFLCFAVFASFGMILFISVVVDVVLYLLRAIIGQSFIRQALSRYYRLFPEAGRKPEEREYDTLLKKRNKMLDAEISDRRREKASDFYDDEDYESEEYEDDEYYPDDEYEDDYYPEDECAADYDEDYDEDYDDRYEDGYDEEYIEDFEDDYDDPRSRHHGKERADSHQSSGNATTFDFFAGCNSRASVDKKYRSLVKLYHPDNMDGDTAALQEINVQYDKAKKSWPT